MKRLCMLGLAVVLAAGFTFSALAADNEQPMPEKQKMMETGKMPGQWHKDHEFHHMCPMCGMMKSMSRESLVATTDGGVVVLMGHTLLKYNSQLKLVKKVEINTDMGNKHKMMMEKMGKCPMHGEMNKRMHEGKMEKSGSPSCCPSCPMTAPAQAPSETPAKQ